MGRGLSMVRWGALALATALGPPRAAAVQVYDGAVFGRGTAAGNQTSLSGTFPCRCKPVNSVSECPDNKHPEEPWKPNGPRYFHAAGEPGGEGAGNLCCKLVHPDLFASSHDHDAKALCNNDVRKVPETGSCRLRDQKGTMCFRVKKVTSERRVVDTGRKYDFERDFWTGPKGAYDFKKFPPKFLIEDIYGAVDHDGKEVDDSIAQQFVKDAIESNRFVSSVSASDRFGQSSRKTGNQWCGGSEGTMKSLFEDAESCLLRDAPTQQCCCAADQQRPERCLTVEDAAVGQDAEPREVDGFKEKIDGNSPIMYDEVLKPPLTENGMRKQRLDKRADPEQQEMLFSWKKVDDQWVRECIDRAQPRIVVAKKMEETIDNYKRRKVLQNKASYTYTGSENQVHWEYSAGTGKKLECRKYRLTRRCPAGQGLYQRQIVGTCMGKDQLKRHDLPAPSAFTCPEDHKSSLKTTECRCDECK